MKYRIYILGMLLQVGYTISACSNTNNPIRIAEEVVADSTRAQSVQEDANRAVELAELGYGEIELAKTARQKTGNRIIKEIASRLQTDQTRLMKGLTAYAANRNVQIPDSATGRDQQLAERMAENNQQAKFDKKWCVEMLNRHEAMIAKMEEDATIARDTAFRIWINDALPTLRMHRDELMQLKYKLR